MIPVGFATKNNAPAISKIFSDAWRITYKDLYSKEYIERVIKEFYNLDRIKRDCSESSKGWHGYMIATDDKDEVLGCIGGAVEEDTGFIYVLYVHPERKKEGVGSALLDFLIIEDDLYYETRSSDGVLVEGSEVKEVDATLSSIGLEHICPTKDGAFLMREISHAEKFYFFDAAKNETFERALDKPLKSVENVHSQAISLDDNHLYLIKAYKGAPSEGDGWQISTLIIN